MSVLADVSGPEAIKAFRRAAWRIQRRSGSHVVLLKEGIRKAIVVPVHGGKPIKRGLLLAAIRVAGLPPDEIRDLLLGALARPLRPDHRTYPTVYQSGSSVHGGKPQSGSSPGSLDRSALPLGSRQLPRRRPRLGRECRGPSLTHALMFLNA
ncbi:MAG: type II toxin-antitoxin system HicA family toxin [Thermoplasmata archaeon]|nr:type II toxin-antitoxin system HicA family toxin [Thermoplasmata archaeon]